MPVIPQGQNLFIVDINYIAPFDDIKPEIDAHMKFLEENYASGRFIASGPKVPRTGGIIIATAGTRGEIESLLEADPFKKRRLAQYTVTEFRPSMMVEKLRT